MAGGPANKVDAPTNKVDAISSDLVFCCLQCLYLPFI